MAAGICKFRHLSRCSRQKQLIQHRPRGRLRRDATIGQDWIARGRGAFGASRSESSVRRCRVIPPIPGNWIFDGERSREGRGPNVPSNIKSGGGKCHHLQTAPQIIAWSRCSHRCSRGAGITIPSSTSLRCSGSRGRRSPLIAHGRKNNTNAPAQQTTTDRLGDVNGAHESLFRAEQKGEIEKIAIQPCIHGRKWKC